MRSEPCINIQVLDFKNSIPATSCLNDDGSYTIFLNSRLNIETQSNAYLHELGHIVRLDFDNSHSDVNVIESYAHRLD